MRGRENADPAVAARPGFLLVQILTLSRVPLAAAFAVLILTLGHPPAVVIVCLGVLLLSELTDLFDGLLARRFAVATEFGEMMDPYADSISRLVVYWALACAGLILPFVPLVMALRDITVAYCRILVTRRGRSVAARWSGKLKAGVLAPAGMLALLGPFYWVVTGTWTIPALSWLVVLVTAASAMDYAAAAARQA